MSKNDMIIHKSKGSVKYPANQLCVKPNEDLKIRYSTGKHKSILSSEILYVDKSTENYNFSEREESKTLPTPTTESKTKENKKLSPYSIYLTFISSHHTMILNGNMYLYHPEKGYYIALKDTELQRYIRNSVDKTLKPYLTKNLLSEVIEFLYSECEKVILEEDKDKYKHLIPFQNCVYDSQKNTVYQTLWEYPFTHALKAKFYFRKNILSLGIFKNFVQTITNDDQELKLLLSQVMGYLLSSYTECKKAFFLIGPSGTGKTTLINLIISIIGKENISSVPFDKLDMRFNRVALYNKLLNCSAELTNKSLHSLDFFKQITGNDYIQAEYKGKDSFTFKCSTKLLFAGNNYPNVTNLDESNAFFNRLIFIPFIHQISETQKDAHLLEKLILDVDSVISFSLDGLSSLIDNNFTFSKCTISEKFKQNYIRNIDSIKEFVETKLYITENENDKIFLKDLYEAYCNHCHSNCQHIYDINVFRQQIKQYGNLGKIRIKDQTLSGVKGISFRV